MSNTGYSAGLVAVMSLVTVFLRAFPFLVFRKKVPPFILYLGEVLPPAIIGMLVVYCLRDTRVLTAPFGLPEFLSLAAVVLLQAWKRNSLLSILSGTAVYMLLAQFVF